MRLARLSLQATSEFDVMLQRIAQSFDNNSDVKFLGSALEFEPADVDAYTENERQDGDYIGTLDMLRKWAEMQADSTKRAKLQSALLEAQLLSLADKDLSKAEANTSLHSTSTAHVVCEVSLTQNAENDRHSTQPNEDSQDPIFFEERWSSQTQQEFDIILKKIARSLYKRSEIDDLGSALGFGTADIGRCNDENERQGGSYMGTLTMLRTWEKLQTDSTKRTNLRIALVAAELVSLAERYLCTAGELELNRCVTAKKEEDKTTHQEIPVLTTKLEIAAPGKVSIQARIQISSTTQADIIIIPHCCSSYWSSQLLRVFQQFLKAHLFNNY